LYGEQWLPAAVPLQILCLYGGVMALGSWGYVFNALGKPHIPFYLNVIRATGIVILIYPLTSRYGLVGVAWSVAIPMVIQFAVQVVIISRVLGLGRLHLVRIIGAIAANSAIMALVLALAKRVEIEHPVLSIAFLAFVGGGSYLALNYRHIRALTKGAGGISAPETRPAA
jgi:O-antigen/teichoic acid export membrane protein